MSTISQYVLENKDRERDGYTYDSLTEARGVADMRARHDGEPWAVIELEFEYADSSLAYTTDLSVVWPPEEEGSI